MHALGNALASAASPGLAGRLFGLVLPDGRRANVSIHTHAGRTIVEFEPENADLDANAPLLLVRTMLDRMQQARSVADACAVAVNQLKLLIGFDRVMIYRFLEDGSGSVIAESLRPELEPYLGHHYPASDIPQQARALYTRNWLRVISDVKAPNVPLAALSATDEPVDLSYCSLRSVSPVHIEYLRNMNVGASLSVSIVVGGTLWGLIACHHAHARLVPTEVRVATELFGQTFSLQLQSLQRVDVTRLLQAARTRLDRILSELPASLSLKESLGQRLADLAGIVPCTGAGLWIDGTWQSQEVALAPAQAEGLVRFLNHTSAGQIYATHELSQVYPPAAAYADIVSGVLAVPLSREPGDYLIFFRREFIHSVNWAGDPSKPLLPSPSGERLTPRKSFELWREEVRNTSRRWESSDRLMAEALRISLLEVVLKFNEIIATERAKAAEQQRIFATELNHRVKNALALVGALVRQSRARDSGVEDFVADLEGRIRSLALAHDQAIASDARSLISLLRTELSPFADADRPRITLDGPDLQLDGRAFAVLALVVHELTTNAAKYGAFRFPGGALQVRWQIGPNGDCRLRWIESGVNDIRQPESTGFGSTLITRQIPFELGGKARLAFEASGLSADFLLPARHFVVGDEAPAPQYRGAPIPLGPASSGRLEGAHVLVVEDSLLVALQTEAILRRAGAASVVICSGTDEALARMRETRPDAAVLDINLVRETSVPVADALIEGRVPFVFATGYQDGKRLPARFAQVPQISKPYASEALVSALAAELLRRKTSDGLPS
jgi:light-regulated signal transduction histidine kinase (bacteriophytochrome)/CheY-like chemotaxis protein